MLRHFCSAIGRVSGRHNAKCWKSFKVQSAFYMMYKRGTQMIQPATFPAPCFITHFLSWSIFSLLLLEIKIKNRRG